MEKTVLKKIEPVFEKGTAEEYLAKNSSIPVSVLDLSHDHFAIHKRGEDDIVFEIDDELSKTFFYANIIQNREMKLLSYLDIVLSPYTDDSYEVMSSLAGDFTLDRFKPDNFDHNLRLLAFICMRLFSSKYDKLTSISDFTEPVPLQVFINVSNKAKEKPHIYYKDDDGIEIAGLLDRIQLQRSMFGISLSAIIMIVSRGADGFVSGRVRIPLSLKRKVMKLEDLGIYTVTEEKKAQLKERGKKYVKYATKPAYCQHEGFAWRPGAWFGDVRTNVHGRVMIDAVSMRMMNSSLDDDWYTGNIFNEDEVVFPEVAEDNIWMCSPYLFGFSLGTKEWIRMCIDNVSDIKFSENAFAELIVPETYKEIFLACLQQNMPSLDSISDKGEGTIVMLYGPPGCGKTLTAESVAELLRIPLYYVSVGELGVSPETLEERMTKIMQVASNWNALILLDEVDVFATKREGSNDMGRIAMTAILLRLLERYKGVMFMTTNLRDNLDPAFVSRATISIPYQALDYDDREKIWNGMLHKVERHGVVVDDKVYSNVKRFAKHELNGREIKNHVRLAFSMASRQIDKKLTPEILDCIIGIKA